MRKTTSSSPADRTVTLSGVVETFLAEEGLTGKSPATIQAHRNALRQFGKFWGERDLREAAPADLEAYARELRGRVSRETAYGYLAAVRALFGHLAEKSILLVDPSRTLPLPRMNNRPLGRVLSREGVARVLDSTTVSTPIGLRDRALLELLYSTGLRISEVRKLKMADLGEDAVTVRAGKGGKDRGVPLGQKAFGWVDRYVKEGRPALAGARPQTEEIFLGARGGPLGIGRLRQIIRRLGERAGVGDLTCHAIRRSMATHLLQAGANPKEVSAILGHSDLTSLSRYVRVAAREVKETHQRTHPREIDL